MRQLPRDRSANSNGRGYPSDSAQGGFVVPDAS